jgi:hypothetical protein
MILDTLNHATQGELQRYENNYNVFNLITTALCRNVYDRVAHLETTLDDSVWGIKITALEESANFATLDSEKLVSKLKSHELCRKGRLNHDASLTSKAFATSVGGHVANSTNTTDSSALEFTLSLLCAISDE